MQEVFEKIIEKVGNKIFSAELYGDEWNGQTVDNLLCLGDVRDVIEQAAAEYSNGWIPCSKRLPEAENLHEKSIEECTEYLIQRRCGVMDVAKYIKVYGEPHFSANALSVKDVIAWQPLPEPYQQKGE